jgi:phosphoglycolate phosphatase
LASAAPVRVFAVDAIAFDLDGTLLDTVHDLAAAVNLLLAGLALPPIPVAIVRSMVGKGVADLLAKALTRARGARPDADEVAALLPAYQSGYAAVLGRETVLFPGVLSGLARMRDAGFRLAVVTNKATRFVAPHLAHAGISEYFDVVVGGDDAVAKKPDAAPLVLAAQRMRVPPTRMLMVGDSVNDVEAARAAGSPVLVLPYGYNEGAPVQTLAADGIVDSLDAVADQVTRHATPSPD